jgi:hypothetical protein
MSEAELLAARLSGLRVDPQARLGFDLFAGGVVWSDEVPEWDFNGVQAGQFPAGLGLFRNLLNYRHALIVGGDQNRFQGLWDEAMKLCPQWPGFLPGRRDPVLAEQCKAIQVGRLHQFEVHESHMKQRPWAVNRVNA